MRNVSSKILIILFCCSCQSRIIKTTVPTWTAYDQAPELAANKDHETRRLQYTLIQSKYLDKNKIWEPLIPEMQYFGKADYESLKSLILEQNIPTIQGYIKSGKLSYERLTLWYLHRIVMYESNPETTLHSIIALNPEAVKEARLRDQNKSVNDHLIYGMPILLKDNISTKGMKTTAGAVALQNNQTADDAFIVKRLKSNGAIILGKANLSEWAYFFCGGCPVGYSAMGGQTLNPYGRRAFETGGSSSGSGTTVAANYAVGAVGTETSGSILSPSSKNSVVGMKPTVGLLSRGGIVPISSTLDTPGPMTKSVTDNAILLSAMSGEDTEDPASSSNSTERNYFEQLKSIHTGDLRLGANKRLLESDSIYALRVERLKDAGATIIEFDPPEIELTGFGSLLSIDMKHDLPKYLSKYAGAEVDIKSVQDVIDFNLTDTLGHAPYGQVRLAGSLTDPTTLEQLEDLKIELQKKARAFFAVMEEHNLDAVLSVNNYNARFAAAAKYPCFSVPMGYSEKGEPTNLTFIGKPYSEALLLQMGFQFEQLTKVRKMPKDYQ